MAERIEADASPEKRLFISLITRDISLADAFLDLIDNSINSALEPLADKLQTADDYEVLAASRTKPKVNINLTVGAGRIIIDDNGTGISWKMAQEHVFKFGRPANEGSESDRLSVYGIGLKRAIFKCGNKIEITSDHREGGFELKLDVRKWERIREGQWTFDIEKRAPIKSECGTRITISELHEDVVHRLSDGLFLPQLREKITQTYSFFIGRVVTINVNKAALPAVSFNITKNVTVEKFRSGRVSCNITAGFAAPEGDVYREKNAGWHVFCNGRTVLSAEKSSLTGWVGGGSGLPLFQPKHRPFLGIVFFVSTDPEQLPWTTTKGTVNEENLVWQEAKRRMIKVGRVVVAFLDGRYTEEGTEFKPSDLKDAAEGKVSVLKAVVSQERSFKVPVRAAPQETKIQYLAKVSQVKK